MARDKPFGLSPFDVDMANLAMGQSYPMTYGEYGYMLSAMWKRIPETAFRPRFLAMCGRGLIGLVTWDEMHLDLRLRRVQILDRGIDAIREIGKWNASRMGDADLYFHFTSFDPNHDYAKDPSALDRFTLGKKFGFKKQKRKPTRQQIMDPRWRQSMGITGSPEEVRARREFKFV